MKRHSTSLNASDENFLEDGLTNNWGVNYIRLTQEVPRRNMDKKELDNLVRASVPGFGLREFTSCGSQANYSAVLAATGEDKFSCFSGIGCYLSGDTSALQGLSTNDFYIDKHFTVPVTFETAKEPTKDQTVVLPYFLKVKNHNQAVHCKL